MIPKRPLLLVSGTFLVYQWIMAIKASRHRKRPKAPAEGPSDPVLRVWDEYHRLRKDLVSGSVQRKISASTKRSISARIAEFSEAECFDVLAFRHRRCKADPTGIQYYRHSTIFRPGYFADSLERMETETVQTSPLDAEDRGVVAGIYDFETGQVVPHGR